MVKRAVRVNSQLTSHKRFAVAFPKYCELVDNSRLYCTNALGGPPRVSQPNTTLINWVELFLSCNPFSSWDKIEYYRIFITPLHITFILLETTIALDNV